MKRFALTHPVPSSPEASGEGGGHAPLSPSVGEGQGVRANREAHGRDARATEGEGVGVRADTPLSPSVGAGQGVRASQGGE